MDTATPIGFRDGRDARRPAYIPLNIRLRHTHVVGRAGTGKSTLIERMVLDDIRKGHGVAVLDLCGGTLERLLPLIPPEHVDRVAYLVPGDPDWIPLWNPLTCTGHPDRGRVTDSMVLAFKHIIMSMGMGDRLEYVLRQAFVAALHLPDGCLLDVANLLRKNSRRGARLRAQLSVVLKDPFAATFWKEDFDSYVRADYLAVPAHVLANLLNSETVGAMLSQGRSAFDFRRIMENRQVLLVDLSMVGASARAVLAPLILSLLHLTAVGLGYGASSPCPFHIYCDDAHGIELDSVEDLMAEGRRLGVSLTMAQQNMGHVTARGAAALSGVGSTIIFSVDGKDAQVLRESLQGKVDVDDLVTLDVGQAIARIGNEVAQVRTLPPLVMPRVNCRDLIVQQSHERYCRPMRCSQE